MNNLSPWVFDQCPQGWRRYDMLGELEEAARVIRAYLDLWAVGPDWHKDVPADAEGRTLPTSLVYWHLGQVLAFLDRVPEAIEAMENCVVLEPSPSFAAYARGTIAFLRGDHRGLDEALAQGATNHQFLERLKTGLAQGLTYKESY